MAITNQYHVASILKCGIDLSSYPMEEPDMVPYGIPSMDQLSNEAQYRERFVWSMTRALQDTLTSKTICNAWKMAGLFNELTIQQKINSVQPSGISTPFKESDYILSTSPRSAERKRSSIRKHNLRDTSQKSPAKDEKPTSMPKSNPRRKEPQKILARDIQKSDKAGARLQTVITRSGRTVHTYDWSSVSATAKAANPISSD